MDREEPLIASNQEIGVRSC